MLVIVTTNHMHVGSLTSSLRSVRHAFPLLFTMPYHVNHSLCIMLQYATSILTFASSPFLFPPCPFWAKRSSGCEHTSPWWWLLRGQGQFIWKDVFMWHCCWKLIVMAHWEWQNRDDDALTSFHFYSTYVCTVMDKWSVQTPPIQGILVFLMYNLLLVMKQGTHFCPFYWICSCIVYTVVPKDHCFIPLHPIVHDNKSLNRIYWNTSQRNNK